MRPSDIDRVTDSIHRFLRAGGEIHISGGEILDMDVVLADRHIAWHAEPGSRPSYCKNDTEWLLRTAAEYSKTILGEAVEPRRMDEAVETYE